MVETVLDILVHPLVLLNISDYYTRLAIRAGSEPPRLAGICLGNQDGRRLSIETTFEILLEGPELGTVNAAYLEAKLDQYKQVFPTLDVMAWFTVGAAPTQCEATIQSSLATRFENPLLLLLDPRGLDSSDRKAATDLPLRVFESPLLDALAANEVSPEPHFTEVPWALETGEAERIAVDHVSKQNRTKSGSADDAARQSEDALVGHLTAQANAVRMLQGRIQLLRAYCRDVQSGAVPADNEILKTIAALLQRLPVGTEERAASSVASRRLEVEVLLARGLNEVVAGSNALGELIDLYGAVPRAARNGGSGGGGNGPGAGGRTREGGLPSGWV